MIEDLGINYKKIIKDLDRIANLPRHLISDGYDEALEIIKEIAIQNGFEFIIHSYPTGYDCGTWVIPEKWTLNRSTLTSKSGEIILDSNKDPLSCVSYSESFNGEVNREDLLGHIHTSLHQPNATPFIFKYYKREWGLCCSEEIKRTLTDESYHVNIDTTFSNGELKVGEIISKGKLDESFVYLSHLCHPYQVNDGPIGIFPLMEIIKKLKESGNNYTIRQLIVPENIGSAAWLSKNKLLIPKLKGGLFVEMIGTDLKLRVNHSFSNNSVVDDITSHVLDDLDIDYYDDVFVYANDEKQFNGPGVNVPILGVNRSNMTRKPEVMQAFDFYHTSLDTISNINSNNMRESIYVINELINAYDNYLIKPSACFIGEPFLSRYNLHIDAFEGMDQHRSNEEMMDLIFYSGKNLTVYEISNVMNISMKKAKNVYDKLLEKGLIEFTSF